VALRNTTRDAVLASRPRIAQTFRDRAQGMIGRGFEGFDALIIPRCSSIHTWFMGMALDLLFLDASGRVLRVEPDVPPWRVLWGPRGTRTVVELPSSTLRKVGIQPADAITWEETTDSGPVGKA
jgi:uncharacterized membrane protein (UPF0127 family)